MTRTQKFLTSLFLIVCVVYGLSCVFLINFAARAPHSALATYPVSGSDSTEYATLARSIVVNHAYTLSQTAPYELNTFRAPGYPAFVAVLYKLTGSFNAVVLAQMVLVFLSAVLIQKIAESLLGDTWSWLPAFLYVLDPTTIFNSLFVLSDSLYVFTLLLSIYFLVTCPARMRYWVLGSIMLALGIYIRPIGMYLPIVLIGLSWLVRTLSFKQWLTKAVIMIGIIGVMVTPWFIRNHSITNVWGFSSVSAYNLLYYNAPQFLAHRTRETVADARDQLFSGIGLTPETARGLESSKTVSHAAFAVIETHPISYTFYHLTAGLPFFYTSGLKTAAVFILGLAHTNYTLVKILFLLESLSWLVFSILALASLGQLRYKKAILVFVCIIGYYFVLTGPVVYSRYRMPASPFIFIAATITLKTLADGYHRQEYNFQKPHTS
jgi:4-amino-4-deoxy-L-arabinose transferase-like glycosyltransferase